MNILFSYNKKRILAKNVNDVVDWIDSFPTLTCNEHCKLNIDLIFNGKWKKWGHYNQHESPINKDGYILEYLKTTGIRTGKILFQKTNCSTLSEVEEEEEIYRKSMEKADMTVKEKTDKLAKEVLAKLNRKSKSCVKIYKHSDFTYVIMIGQRGFWTYWNHQWAYMDEYFTHFNSQTLTTEEGKNVIEVLNSFLQ
jgi:hypothetical protein